MIPFQVTIAEENVYKEFYSAIDSVKTLEINNRLNAIQDFISKYPKFEDGYLALLQWCVFENQTSLAVSYFESLLPVDASRQNAAWMLALLAKNSSQSDRANFYFHKALKYDQPSWRLIKSYFEYIGPSKEKAAELKSLNSYFKSTDTLNVIKAFAAYFDSKDSIAIEHFKFVDQSYFQDRTILDILGYCYFYGSHEAIADSIWKIGLENTRKRGDLRTESRFLSNRLLLLQNSEENYDWAVALQDSIEILARRSVDYYRLQIVSGYRGFINRDTGKYKDALGNFSQAISIASRLNIPRFNWDWYRGISMTYYYLGQYTTALSILDSSEVLAKKSNNNELQIRTLLDKAEIYIRLKQLVLARSTLDLALAFAREEELHQLRASAESKIAHIYTLQKRFREAKEAFKKYIQFIEQTPALRKSLYWALGRAGQAYLAAGDYVESKTIFKKALNASKRAKAKAFTGWYYLRLGQTELALGNLDSAKSAFDAGNKIALSEAISDLQWNIYIGYGDILFQNGETKAAIKFYEKAANSIEKTRESLSVDQLRIGYFEDGYTVYDKIVECYLRLLKEFGEHKSIENVYRFHEMGRSRALVDMIQDNTQKKYPATYIATRNNLQSLQRQLRIQLDKNTPESEIEATLDQLKIARLSLLAQQLLLFDDQSPQTHQKINQTKSLSELQQNLQSQGAAILIYHLSSETSFALAVLPDTAIIVELQTTTDSLLAAVNKLITPFHKTDVEALYQLPFHTDIAFQLYQTLVAKIEAAINLPEQLIIIPDAALAQLPFELLLTEKPPANIYTPQDIPVYVNAFLLNRYQISYSPGASAFQKDAFSPPPYKPAMLIVANPDFRHSASLKFRSVRLQESYNFNFTKLPFTELEARKIRDVYPAATIYKQGEALEEVLFAKMAEHQIVHLSTHGFVDSTFDAFSGLALTIGPDSTDDGLFMGYEMQSMLFDCDLITLSACETGRGRLVAGEGVLGLPRLLIGAGAKSVLMTLWKVDDEFTSKLMPAFYRYYFQEQQNKTGALTLAKRDIIQGKYKPDQPLYYQHPFFWAAFTLYGAPGAAYGSTSRWDNPWNIFAYCLLMLLIFFSAWRFIRKRS